MNKPNILKMESIDKSFAGVSVLHEVQFSICAGEIRALVGENGAGKSTLMKILCGIYEKDRGKIWIDGEEIRNYTIQEASRLGVAMIHQEIVLVQDLPVSENIFLGNEPQTPFGTVDFRSMREKTWQLLKEMDMNEISPDTLVRELSISQQQMIEIARAIAKNARILIMDEPTSSLSDKEVDLLFKQIEKMKKKEVAVIYISHKMDEIFKIADSITIMRDGCHIVTQDIEGLSYDEIIRHMVGRKISEYYPPHKEKAGDVILDVKGVTTNKVKNVSFQLHKGEIFGLAGLVGAGRTEMAEAIFGLDPILSGEIRYDGEIFSPKTPGDAVKKGIGMVPEDRKRNGLFLENSIAYNMTIAVLDKFIKFVFSNKKKEKGIVGCYIEKLSIKMANTEQLMAELSGGNQQKVVFSKWMAMEPKILILDEPTRGIDVGAKAEIYHLMNQIAETGVSIIMISSELPEILNLSTRIGVMCEGSLVKIFNLQDEEVSQEKIMYYATGGHRNEK